MGRGGGGKRPKQTQQFIAELQPTCAHCPPGSLCGGSGLRPRGDTRQPPPPFPGSGRISCHATAGRAPFGTRAAPRRYSRPLSCVSGGCWSGKVPREAEAPSEAPSEAASEAPSEVHTPPSVVVSTRSGPAVVSIRRCRKSEHSFGRGPPRKWGWRGLNDSFMGGDDATPTIDQDDVGVRIAITPSSNTRSAYSDNVVFVFFLFCIFRRRTPCPFLLPLSVAQTWSATYSRPLVRTVAVAKAVAHHDGASRTASFAAGLAASGIDFSPGVAWRRAPPYAPPA